MKDGICPRCNSQEIVPHVDAVEKGDGLAIRIYERPDVTLRGIRYFPLKAWICANCGYTELYINDPQDLAQAHRRFLKASRD